MFVPAPRFRITESAEHEWAMPLDPRMPSLHAVVEAAFDGTALVAFGPMRLREGVPIWKVGIDVLGWRAELKVRCDQAGRWTSVLSAWGVPL